MISRTISVSNIRFEHVPEGYTVTPVTTSIRDVVVYGRSDQMAALTDQDLVAVVDLERWISPRGAAETPLQLSAPGKGLVWCSALWVQFSVRRRTDQTENSATELPSAGWKAAPRQLLFIKERQEQPMSILVSSISVPFQKGEAAAVELALRRAGVKNPKSAYIVKSSVDARRRSEIKFVYTVGIECDHEEEVVRRAGDSNVRLRKPQLPELVCGGRTLANRPVVIGFGPAGMFAALTLARMGYAPLVLERGGDVDSRVAAVEGFWKGGSFDDLRSNVQFGEGSAGTFWDGKLTTRINDPLCETVLEAFVAHEAESLHPAKGQAAHQHRLPAPGGEVQSEGVDPAGRRGALQHPGDRFFPARSGRLTAVRTEAGEIPAEVVILAVGHSARDTSQAVRRAGAEIQPKPFSVASARRASSSPRSTGPSLVTLQAIPRLPVGESQLSYRENDRGVYTFCMCPGRLCGRRPRPRRRIVWSPTA